MTKSLNLNSYGFIRIRKLLVKFINNLKKYSFTEQWGFVKKEHLQLIYFKSYFVERNNQSKNSNNQLISRY